MNTSKLFQVLLVVGLTLSAQFAHARDRDNRVQVSVSYDITMPKPDDTTLLEDAMRQARELVYSRVKLECVEMKRHIAQTCELTRLDINQGAKASRREGRPGSLTVRAKARYKIDLKEQ